MRSGSRVTAAAVSFIFEIEKIPFEGQEDVVGARAGGLAGHVHTVIFGGGIGIIRIK